MCTLERTALLSRWLSLLVPMTSFGTKNIAWGTALTLFWIELLGSMPYSSDLYMSSVFVLFLPLFSAISLRVKYFFCYNGRKCLKFKVKFYDKCQKLYFNSAHKIVHIFIYTVFDLLWVFHSCYDACRFVFLFVNAF